MNGLSIRDICCLFCWPPCPSSIASKMAFIPPEPTYSFTSAEEGSSKMTLHLTEKAEWQFTDKEKECIEVFYTRTTRGNTISCMFVRCSPTARYCILFSHGNAADLGHMSSFYLSLGTRIDCNIFSYDYSGMLIIHLLWHAVLCLFFLCYSNYLKYIHHENLSKMFYIYICHLYFIV